MATTLTSTVENQDDATSVVRLGGRLDITSAAEAKRLFAETVQAGTARLVVDLGGITFIDSSGLSALVSGLRSCRQAGGDLRIAEAGEQPKAVFALTSLDQVFRLYPTVGEALDGFAR
jgi:anti-anti-sigma factor